MYPNNLKYSKEHEWVDFETKRIGITQYAQEALGDVVFVELPEVGTELEVGDTLNLSTRIPMEKDGFWKSRLREEKTNC